MKNISLFIFLTPIFLFSQDLEVGQKWHYTQFVDFWSPDEIYTIEIIKDTLIDNEKYFVLNQGCVCNMPFVRYIQDAGDQYYVYYEGGKHLLFDFTLRDGDTLITRSHFGPGWNQDSIYVKIDSVRKYELGGKTRDVFYIDAQFHRDQQYNADWGPQYIRGIGSTYWCLIPKHGICEGGITRLRCIEFADGSTLIINPKVSCKTVSVEDLNSHPLNISPNPSHTLVQIQGESNGVLTITDIQGKLQFRDHVDKEITLDIAHWPQGVYVFKLKHGQDLWMSKFVKN